MFTNSKNLTRKINNSVKSEITRRIAMVESKGDIRNRRQGYRSTGIYQLSRHFSSEGVYTIGLGGSPVVGK